MSEQETPTALVTRMRRTASMVERKMYSSYARVLPADLTRLCDGFERGLREQVAVVCADCGHMAIIPLDQASMTCSECGGNNVPLDVAYKEQREQIQALNTALTMAERERDKWKTDRDAWQRTAQNNLTLAYEYDEKHKAAERLLCDLTPGGSEFVGNPQRCHDWVRQEISGNIAGRVQAVAARKEAEGERDEARCQLAEVKGQADQMHDEITALREAMRQGAKGLTKERDDAIKRASDATIALGRAEGKAEELERQLTEERKRRLEAERVCDHPGCLAAVIRHDDGSRHCAAGHTSRWVEATDLYETRRQLAESQALCGKLAEALRSVLKQHSPHEYWSHSNVCEACPCAACSTARVLLATDATKQALERREKEQCLLAEAGPIMWMEGEERAVAREEWKRKRAALARQEGR